MFIELKRTVIDTSWMKTMKYKRRIRKKDKSKMIIIVLLVIVLAAGVFAVMSYFEHSSNKQQSSSYIEEDILSTKEKTVDGITYQHKRKLHSYLFIGVDMRGEAVGVENYIQGGQGDVQMVLTIDDTNRTWQILQINRDAMVNVNVLGVTGDVVSNEFQQICLAHSYGNGKESSCENNVSAVSEMLEDEKIDGYFALNMDAIGLLNEIAGGVTVTVTSDFSKVDPTLAEGSTITLTDEQATTFIHDRKDVDDETNLSRMARQREFMNGFFTTVKNKDANFAKDAYNRLSNYTVTDIKEGTVSKILNKIQNYTEKDIVTIDGNLTVEDDHWCYYQDENSLAQAIVEMFYDKKG